jgi:hypothetical protein
MLLVGTNHSDPEGYVRLKRLLTRFQPEEITFELEKAEYYSSFVLLPFLRAMSKVVNYDSKSSAQHLAKQLRVVGFELEAISQYRLSSLICGKMIRLTCIDAKTKVIDVLFPGWDTGPSSPRSSLYEVSPNISECLRKSLEFRDDFALSRLISYASNKSLHVGGLEHAFGNYHNLYEKLREKSIPVERIKLCDC